MIISILQAKTRKLKKVLKCFFKVTDSELIAMEHDPWRAVSIPVLLQNRGPLRGRQAASKLTATGRSISDLLWTFWLPNTEHTEQTPGHASPALSPLIFRTALKV